MDPLASIGFPIEPRFDREVLDRASLANRHALERHQAGDYEASRHGFEAALTAAPGLDIARFNLACALARLGDHAGAARELRTTLEHDLPRFLPRMRDDPDLASFRASPELASLSVRVAELSQVWDEAIRVGLPAVVFWLPAGGTRFGFWLPAQRRFVPVVAVTEGEQAVIDVSRRRVAYLTTDTVGDIEADMAWALTSVGVAGYAPGDREVRASLSSEQADTSLWRLTDPTGDEARFLVYPDQFTAIRRGRAAQVLGAHSRPVPLRVDERPPAGFSLRGNTLHVPDGEPITLGRGHGAAPWHSYARSADGRRLIVASSRNAGSEAVEFEQYATLHRTVIDHVDLETATVTRLATADADAFVVEHAGDAYVATSPRATRYVGLSATEREELPEGLAPLPVFDGERAGATR